jgi:hypothetical protein
MLYAFFAPDGARSGAMRAQHCVAIGAYGVAALGPGIDVTELSGVSVDDGLDGNRFPAARGRAPARISEARVRYLPLDLDP